MERLSFQHRRRPPGHNAIAAVMKCAAPTSLVAVAARAGANGADSAAKARALCVGGPHCYPTIQAALDASQDGDTIKVGPGGGADLVVRTVAC